MFKRIDHVEIVASDFEHSIEFYREILGFQERERITIPGHPPLIEVAFLTLGDTMLETLHFDGPEPPVGPAPRVGYCAMALEVDSMDAAIAYLAGKGIHPSVPPVDVGGGSLRGEIADPDGLTIELRQW
jgi:catechol 2,3-dioxygenase-like lactoylglutathione lyase family enzyme